jgi:hypothetical protein
MSSAQPASSIRGSDWVRFLHVSEDNELGWHVVTEPAESGEATRSQAESVAQAAQRFVSEVRRYHSIGGPLPAPLRLANGPAIADRPGTRIITIPTRGYITESGEIHMRPVGNVADWKVTNVTETAAIEVQDQVRR